MKTPDGFLPISYESLLEAEHTGVGFGEVTVLEDFGPLHQGEKLDYFAISWETGEVEAARLGGEKVSFRAKLTAV